MNQPVGIVLVSHSPGLASGLAELLAEITSGAVPVLVAAGTEDGRTGTSYELISKAIAGANRGAGVAVLPDIGSSVLTARIVLDDRPDPDVLMLDTPFVEGAVAVAATAAAGADLAAVAAAAEEARHVRKF